MPLFLEAISFVSNQVKKLPENLFAKAESLADLCISR